MKRIFRQVPTVDRLSGWMTQCYPEQADQAVGASHLFSLWHQDLVPCQPSKLGVLFEQPVVDAADRLPAEFASSQKIRYLTEVVVGLKWQALGRLKGRTRMNLARRVFRLGDQLPLEADNLLMYECGVWDGDHFEVIGSEILIGPVNPARLVGPEVGTPVK